MLLRQNLQYPRRAFGASEQLVRFQDHETLMCGTAEGGQRWDGVIGSQQELDSFQQISILAFAARRSCPDVCCQQFGL